MFFNQSCHRRIPLSENTDFWPGLRACLPRSRLHEVSRGHTTNFPFMPTIITTHTLSLLLIPCVKDRTLPLRRVELYVP